MKKILIDAVSLLSPLTGIGRYTYEISKSLKECTRDKYEIFFNYGCHSKELYGQSSPSRKEQRIKKLQHYLKKIPLIKRMSRYLYAGISKFYKSTYDIYFQPSYIPNSAVKSHKVVCTVHDFSFLLQPHWHPKERVDYLKKEIHAIKKANHVITGSNFTKNEIIKYLQIDEKKITVIYHGVNHSIYKRYPKQVIKATKIKYNLPNQFLLFVGSIEPRKNLLMLLQAYNTLTPSQKNDLALIVVGFSGWQNQDIMKELHKDKQNISYLGFINDEELAHIYNLCTIFIYPSLYEGFGLPPLEAMACGASIVVSNVASLPEICGDSALYVNPNNNLEIKEAIIHLLLDKELRDTLSLKALSRAKFFTWEKSAKMHCEVFEHVGAL